MGEPVSWLALERYRLGELSAWRRWRVARHLAACQSCAASLADAERVVTLPPLPADVRAPPAPERRRLAPGVRVGVAVAGAGALALVLLARSGAPEHPMAGGSLPGVKGGGIAVALVRERDGAVDEDATTFMARDRWKVLVTCPADRLMFWDVAVHQGPTAAFPLSPAAPIHCGNRVPLPGAFRLDGHGPAEVCLLLASDPVNRAHIASLEPAACITVRPAQGQGF
jgi:hypothetical protein